MSSELTDTRRWIASAGGACVVVAVLFLLLRIPGGRVVERVAPPPPRPVLQLERPGGANKTVNDEVVMHDQRPLFLPTERNVAPRPPRRPEAGRSVLDQDVQRFSFTEAELRLNLVAAEPVPQQAAEAVLSGPASSPLHGFGRPIVEVMPLPARGGFIEIRDAATNRRVLAQALAGEAKPATEKAWRPLEFLAAVDATGLVGQLVITQRSDVAEVDEYFRNYLGQTFRIGERLSPGFYRIVVGP